MRDAQSVHTIYAINNLVSTRRVAPGIYEAVVDFYDYDRVCSSNYEARQKLTIDARQLTVDVRNFKNTGDFELGTIQTPITITSECI